MLRRRWAREGHVAGVCYSAAPISTPAVARMLHAIFTGGGGRQGAKFPHTNFCSLKISQRYCAAAAVAAPNQSYRPRSRPRSTRQLCSEKRQKHFLLKKKNLYKVLMNFRSKFEKRQNKNAARKQAVQFPPAKKTRSEKKRAAVRPEPVWQEPVWSRHRLMHQLLQNALNSVVSLIKKK